MASSPTTIRTASSTDVPFLERMLYEAANWRGSAAAPEVPLSDPRVAKYVAGWGADVGDLGLIAEDENGAPVGAAWYRLFSAERPGFGFVADDVPEVTIAVEARFRGRGVGRALLNELIHRAAQAGIRALSLSVEEDNPAVGLYASCGFVQVAVADGARTMVRVLTRSPG